MLAGTSRRSFVFFLLSFKSNHVETVDDTPDRRIHLPKLSLDHGVEWGGVEEKGHLFLAYREHRTRRRVREAHRGIERERSIKRR